VKSRVFGSDMVIGYNKKALNKDLPKDFFQFTIKWVKRFKF